MEKQFEVEISTAKINGDGYYHASLELPAEDYEITDALQKVRAIGRTDSDMQIDIYESELLSELSNARFDSLTLDELNFFAKRLSSLSYEERIVLQAVIDRVFPEDYELDIVSIKDLINITYGLDEILIAPDVGNDEQLGQFTIENGIHPDVASVPDEAIYLLDKKQIGKMQRENDGGVYVNGFYVVAGEYEMPEIYDGKTLPSEEAPGEWFAFQLNVAAPPENDSEDNSESAEWINLPVDKEKTNRIAQEHGVNCIEDCVYYGFKSSLPQLSADMFGDMKNFDELNALASEILTLSPADQIKFKAALQAESPTTIAEAAEIRDRLWEYQFYAAPNGDDDFFKSYLLHYLNSNFDSDWLDTLLVRTEGSLLIDRLGATVTDYGVISARGRSLYELVPYYKTNAEEMKTQSLTDEKLQVVEILGQTALFTNGRITENELPYGLYKYDLREGENIRFAAIEKNVTVNHSGTVLVKTPLDFNGYGYYILDDETAPNFLGFDLTPREFMNMDFSRDEQNEENEQQIGGIQL